MGLAFGEHDALCEIPDEVLFSEPVKTTGEQAYFNEIKRIFVLRAATVVIGVLGDFMHPAHGLLACLGSVRNFFPKHECIGKLRHYGVLNSFRERAAS